LHTNISWSSDLISNKNSVRVPLMTIESVLAARLPLNPSQLPAMFRPRSSSRYRTAATTIYINVGHRHKVPYAGDLPIVSQRSAYRHPAASEWPQQLLVGKTWARRVCPRSPWLAIIAGL
jgi:hypothetical protein